MGGCEGGRVRRRESERERDREDEREMSDIDVLVDTKIASVYIPDRRGVQCDKERGRKPWEPTISCRLGTRIVPTHIYDTPT